MDLAGSERSGDSKNHDKEQTKQTADINTSLAALKVDRHVCWRFQSWGPSGTAQHAWWTE